MKNKNSPYEVIANTIYFLSAYLLITTTNKAFFALLFAIYLIKYITVLKKAVALYFTVMNEKFTSLSNSALDKKAAIRVNRYLIAGASFWTFFLLFIIIYRYPMWSK